MRGWRVDRRFSAEMATLAMLTMRAWLWLPNGIFKRASAAARKEAMAEGRVLLKREGGRARWRGGG